MMSRKLVLALSLTFLWAAGCAHGANDYGDWRVPKRSAATGMFKEWFAGDLEPEDVEMATVGADRAGPDGSNGEEGSADKGRTPEGAAAAGFDASRQFALAEMYYWDGDVERAFELYGGILEQAPAHPLGRFVTARIYDLRDDVVDWTDRVRPWIEGRRLEQVGPLARVYLSLIGQTVRYREWERARSGEPFSADSVGFPTDWRATPRLSPWRTLDFDREFAVESQASLAEDYLAPWYAEDRPVNRRHTRAYRAGGLSLSPDFGGRGIFYLETFVEVEPSLGEGPVNAARDFWLYGNFPAATRVWIDGEEVFERKLGNYGTGKRLRRVGLKPGTHRVLVKIAFEQGYRDWFDLAFLRDGATALKGSELSFSRTPPKEWDGQGTGVLLEGQQRKPAQLEPLLIDPAKAGKAGPDALYLTALAGFYDQQPEFFEPAADALMERFPEFAAGWGLRSAQVQTLWEMPSDKRDARALSYLRKAYEYDGESLLFMTRLAEWLKQRNPDSREVRSLLEVARKAAVADDGADESGDEGSDEDNSRLRNVGPLEAWAQWLDDQGYGGEAERAWKQVLAVAPSDCRAARALQNSYYGRDHYPPLESLTPEFERCPTLQNRLDLKHPERSEAKLAYYRRRAERYPWRADHQMALVRELRRQGRGEAAVEHLRAVRDRMPWEDGLWDALAGRALAEDGQQAAVEVLKEAIDHDGASTWQLRRLSTLRNEIPLRDLMMDGKKVALEHLEGEEDSSGQSDAAYYVIDYAATAYEPNGASRTLTHTMVRVMTKGAIDRFAEQNLPGYAEVLRVRTINQDGTTHVPESMAGKSSLSMPGLDEGDFVEVAYLTHDSPPTDSNTHREGIRFFFKMSDISSLHSEYAIFGVDDPKFVRRNGAPEPEPVQSEDAQTGEGVRFVRKNSPRPRREPNSVPGTEFLPWIQMYRKGVTLEGFEVERRWTADNVRSSLEVSHALREQVKKWRKDTRAGTAAEVKDLFYDVAGWFNDPSPTDFSTDVSHALQTRSGSPHLMLHTALRIAGIPSQIYVVKSVYQNPKTNPVQEFRKYRNVLVRAKMPSGEWTWLNPAHQDAMFESVGLTTLGQPAVCVSCKEPNRREVPEETGLENHREVQVDASLDAAGKLTGTATLTFHGIRAASVRATLRRTPEQTRRRKFLDGIMSRLLPGSSLSDFEIRAETERDAPLVFELSFERPNFAPKDSDGVRRIQTTLFREPVASGYAGLRNRVRPMLIPRQRETHYEMTMTLPDGWEATIDSKSGQWDLNSKFGEFSRQVRLQEDGGTLEVHSRLWLPIQRVSTDAYAKFRRWAVSVERSSRFLVTLEK